MNQNQFLTLLKVATRIDSIWVKPKHYKRTFESLQRKGLISHTYEPSYKPHSLISTYSGKVPSRIKASVTVSGLEWLIDNYMNRSIVKDEAVFNQIAEKLKAIDPNYFL